MNSKVSLSSFPGALHCAGDSMGGDLRNDGETLGTRYRPHSPPIFWAECTIAVHAGYFHSTHIPSYDPPSASPWSCACGTARCIMQQHRSASAAIKLLWYFAPHLSTSTPPWLFIIYMILLLPVAIFTDRSTDRPCALDMCNTARIFIHLSNTCVIRRLALLNLGFIEQMSCTPLPANIYNLDLHRWILVCPRTSKSWDCSERSWGFPINHWWVYWRLALGNLGSSKKSTKNKLVNRNWDKRSEGVNVWR